MSKNHKLVILSWSFAPQVIGSPILLNNLFQSYKGKLEAIVGWDVSARVDDDFKPCCQTTYFKPPNKFLGRLFRKWRFKFAFILRYFILKNLKKVKPDVAFLVFPNDLFLVESYKACKKLGIPYVVHMHDLWLENMSNQSLKYALKWEEKILKDAEIVYCMTSTQKSHYDEKYNIDTELLPHTASKNLLNKVELDKSNLQEIEEEKLVLYTGNISSMMNLDAVQQFVKSVEYLPDNYRIKILSSMPREVMEENKVYNPKISYDWVAMEEAQKLQKKADVLFLPLSFKNCSKEEVRTVYATKTLEYLLSGTPILVCSPSDSFHTIDAKEKGWGYTLENDDPKQIAEAIIKLATNKDLANKMVNNAVKEAHERSSEKYAEMVESDIQKIININKN